MENSATIEEMNEVIARFMGGERVRHPDFIMFPNAFGYVCHNNRWWNEKDLKYHSSWDWLMPVVKRIYEINSAAVKSNPTQLSEGYALEVDITCAIREVDIARTHAAVYQFIIWYNKQSNDGE